MAAASDDAKLSALTVNDGTNDLTLTPAFVSGTYTYAANVGNPVTTVTLNATLNDDGAAVSGVTLAGTSIADSDFTDGITVPSLAIGDNVIIVTVTAADSTTQTYTVTVTRATTTSTTTVTISADKTSAVLKGDDITYTLTRTGSTTAALDVTVALTQTGDFLAAADLTKMVTIDAGQSENTFTVAATSFEHFALGATIAGGTLTATVQAGTGYGPGTPASVDVSIVVALTVGFDMASYSVAEEAGSLTVKLVAQTGAGAVTPDASAFVSVSTRQLNPPEAAVNLDYVAFNEVVTFAPSDFSADGSVFKAEKTFGVTILDDAIDEPGKRFNVFLQQAPGLARKYHNFVDASGNSCGDECLTPATIIDTDPVGADIESLEFSSAPANGIDHRTGETITFEVTYDQPVVVNTTSGTSTLEISVGGVTREASYTSISSDNLVLTFSYTVAGADQDQNGIMIPGVHRSQRGLDHPAGDEQRGAPCSSGASHRQCP